MAVLWPADHQGDRQQDPLRAQARGPTDAPRPDHGRASPAAERDHGPRPQGRRRRRTWSAGTSWRRDPTGSGWPTSPSTARGQGCQYTSLAFGRALRANGVSGSMGSAGDCFDNALAESFFATLQTELLDRHHWSTRRQLEVRSSRSSKPFPTRADGTPAWATAVPSTTRRCIGQHPLPNHPMSTRPGQLQPGTVSIMNRDRTSARPGGPLQRPHPQREEPTSTGRKRLTWTFLARSEGFEPPTF